MAVKYAIWNSERSIHQHKGVFKSLRSYSKVLRNFPTLRHEAMDLAIEYELAT